MPSSSYASCVKDLTFNLHAVAWAVPNCSNQSMKAKKTQEKEYPCQWNGCSKIFRRSDHRKTHEKSVHEKNKVSCNLCKKMFHPSAFHRHIEQSCRQKGI